MLRFSIAVMLLSICRFSYASQFMPDNDLNKQDHVSLYNNVSESEFNAVIDRAVKFYDPVFKAFGANLIVNRAWDDSTVNASAYQDGSNWYVNMYGGLARRPEITSDGFAMVLCHEIGHHLGGFPFIDVWAAAEGQSDYYSAFACARAIWFNDSANGSVVVDPTPKMLCDKVYGTDNYRKICYRTMMGSKSTADLLSTLSGETASFDTPDLSVVRQTNVSYPKTTQCRLDTYMSGALCVAAWEYRLIPKTEYQSLSVVCSKERGFTLGIRPKCWFKSAFAPVLSP